MQQELWHKSILQISNTELQKKNCWGFSRQTEWNITYFKRNILCQPMQWCCPIVMLWAHGNECSGNQETAARANLPDYCKPSNLSPVQLIQLSDHTFQICVHKFWSPWQVILYYWRNLNPSIRLRQRPYSKAKPYCVMILKSLSMQKVGTTRSHG